MPTVKLGARPKNFKRIVKFKDLDGTTDLSIEVSYIYRTKKQFGEMLDAQIDIAIKEAEALEAKATAAVESDVPHKRERIADGYELATSKQVDYLTQIVDGWNLEMEFSRQSIEDLCDEYPAAPAAISNMYREVIAEGRTGN
jgi:Phage tail assembly chaperone